MTWKGPGGQPFYPGENEEVRREIDALIKQNSKEKESVLRQIMMTNEYK